MRGHSAHIKGGAGLLTCPGVSVHHKLACVQVAPQVVSPTEQHQAGGAPGSILEVEATPQHCGDPQPPAAPPEAAAGLQASGRGQIAEDAEADGSSEVCARCGGLIPRTRLQHHQLYWCSQ